MYYFFPRYIMTVFLQYYDNIVVILWLYSRDFSFFPPLNVALILHCSTVMWWHWEPLNWTKLLESMYFNFHLYYTDKNYLKKHTQNIILYCRNVFFLFFYPVHHGPWDFWSLEGQPWLSVCPRGLYSGFTTLMVINTIKKHKQIK